MNGESSETSKSSLKTGKTDDDDDEVQQGAQEQSDDPLQIGNVSENLFCKEEEDDFLDEINDIATIKFKTNDGESFTKAFKRKITIGAIKLELSTLFSIPTNQITIENGETIVSDEDTLVSLRVEPMGTIELLMKFEKKYTLNKNLIYEYIPNTDVIVVQVNGYNLIVEIENQCRKKKWLGGYRNTATNKYYHHACTQTFEKRNRKATHGTQTLSIRNRETNTPKTKMTQTSPIPSITDKIIKVGTYKPYVKKTKSIVTQPEKTDFIPEIEEKTFATNVTVTTESKIVSVATQLQTLLREITKWNLAENKKLKNWDEKSRRARQIEILNRTRMVLLRIGEEKRKLLRQAYKRNEEEMLSEASKPKVFVTQTGEKIQIDTLKCQEARELHELYNAYLNKTASAETKMHSIVNLQKFFLQKNNFEFSQHVVDLLQRDLDILTYRLKNIPSLKARIDRFIFYYLQLLTAEESFNTDGSAEASSIKNEQQYRTILTHLQNNEMNKFRCFTSIAFHMGVSDIQYLVGTIWKNCSALDESQDLNQLRLTRWQRHIEWSPWNCILLSKHEIKTHLEATDIEEKYDKCFVSKIRNKHLQAKIHFHQISSFHEWFCETK